MDVTQFQQQKEALLKQQQEIHQQLADLARAAADAKKKALDDFANAVKLYDISKVEIRQLLIDLKIEIHTYLNTGRKATVKKELSPSLDTAEILKRKDIADRWDRLFTSGNTELLLSEYKAFGHDRDNVLRYADSSTEAYVLEHATN